MNNPQTQLLVNGRIVDAEKYKAKCRKKGLCITCGKQQTHKSSYLFKSRKQPLTTLDASGNYLVYKGYCLKPTCYTLERARQLLGEIPLAPSPTTSPMQQQRAKVLRPPKIKQLINNSNQDSSQANTQANSSGENSQSAVSVSSFGHPDRRRLRRPMSKTATEAMGASSGDQPPKQQRARRRIPSHSNNRRPISTSSSVLDKSYQILSPEEVRSVIQSELHRGIKTLVLDNCGLGDEGIDALQEALEAINPEKLNLKAICLRWNGVGPKGTRALGRMIQLMSTIETLRLSCNELGDEGIIRLFETVRCTAVDTSCSLKEISVSSNNFGLGGCEAIGDCLYEHAGLRRISLERNPLGDEGVKRVCIKITSKADALSMQDKAPSSSSSQGINNLYLGRTEFGNAGAQELARVLESSQNGIHVFIPDNPFIDNKGASELMLAQERNGNVVLEGLSPKLSSGVTDTGIFEAIAKCNAKVRAERKKAAQERFTIKGRSRRQLNPSEPSGGDSGNRIRNRGDGLGRATRPRSPVPERGNSMGSEPSLGSYLRSNSSSSGSIVASEGSMASFDTNFHMRGPDTVSHAGSVQSSRSTSLSLDMDEDGNPRSAVENSNLVLSTKEFERLESLFNTSAELKDFLSANA